MDADGDVDVVCANVGGSQRPAIPLTGPIPITYPNLNRVTRAGDVNGDGFDDFIAGSPPSPLQDGLAYLFWGGPGADAVAG